MKNKKSLVMYFLILSFRMYAQDISFEGNWKYSFDDSSAYALPAYHDDGWKSAVYNNLSWKKSDLNSNRTVWLRKKILIPSSLKSELSKTGTLGLYLNMFLQEDATYLNGILIGQTDNAAVKRAYPINPRDILWDKENMVSIRIRYWWGEACGLTSVPYLAPALLNTVFILSADKKRATSKLQVKNRNIDYICSIASKSYKTENGIIEAGFYDFNQVKLGSIEKKIILRPGKNSFDFPYTSSSSFLKVIYKVTIPGYNYTVFWNDELGYNNVAYHRVSPLVSNNVREYFSPPELNDQIIRGWLGEKLRANKDRRLYNVDEAGLLKGYINRPGVQMWIGEHVGKFLDAACNTYLNTGDQVLKIQIDRTAQQLMAAQLGNGYLGTYMPVDYWTSWDVWSHKYNIIGLLSYYGLSGYKPALNAAEKAGDLLCATFGMKQGQLDIITAGEHVGMAATSVLDPMVDLYRFTGNKKYLDFCIYITKSYEQTNGPRVISTLNSIGRVDKTANAKAYEMLSNLVGLVKLYKVTGDEQYLKPVLNAWKDIVMNRLYITGTTSAFEHFQDNHSLPAGQKDEMGEGCVTTTWIQLNYQLLCLFGKMEYVDELERSVYNHLTGAENPQTGCVSYYTPLMGVKPYTCNITCCMSSVPRAIAMIPLFANGKLNGAPSFLFYQPGEYKTILDNGKGTGITFNTAADFLKNGHVHITVNPDYSTSFTVVLRKPYWVADFTVTVNGIQQDATTKEIISIKRVWKKGDHINISFTMPVKVLDGGISYPGAIALQRGPQVLVFDKSLNTADPDKITLSTNAVTLQDDITMLPKGWVGTQAYSIAANVNGRWDKIIIVPYADAGQTGGRIETWIKSK